MREPAFAHQVISFNDRRNVIFVDADGDAHQHLLRPFDDFAIHFEEIRALKRLKAEIIIAKIAVIDDRRV